MRFHGAKIPDRPYKASVILLCAHNWEARPFIEHLKLKARRDPNLPFQAFSGQVGETCYDLVLTGQGAVPSAAALSALLQKHQLLYSHGRGLLAAPIIVANYGTAGTASTHCDLGQNLLINKVSGTGPESAIYPERLVKSDFLETHCISVLKPKGSGPTPSFERPVYDMEAFAIARVTELYLSNCHLVIGKFVLDHLSADGPMAWQSLVESQEIPYRDACLEFLNHITEHQTTLLGSQRRVLAVNAEAWAEKLCAEIRNSLPLTATQAHQLRAGLLQFAIVIEGHDERAAKSLDIQELLASREHKTKRGNTRTLSDILGLLHSQTLLPSIH